LSADGHVSLDIYDIGGRKIKTLVDGSMTAGVHSINWNSRNDSGDLVASGTYFYKLTTDTDNMVKKMVLLK
jgi:flagellar hook assembly protein FlgD